MVTSCPRATRLATASGSMSVWSTTEAPGWWRSTLSTQLVWRAFQAPLAVCFVRSLIALRSLVVKMKWNFRGASVLLLMST